MCGWHHVRYIGGNIHAQKASAPAAFSFDVYGDSRSMMYLPHKADQESDARKLMVDMFELSLPATVAGEVVQKDCHTGTANEAHPQSLPAMVGAAFRSAGIVQMKAQSGMSLRTVLPLPAFVLHPLTAVGIAVMHVYLAAGHLLKLFSGEVTWTNVWKGFGALAGAYVFAALASRGRVKRRRQNQRIPDADESVQLST